MIKILIIHNIIHPNDGLQEYSEYPGYTISELIKKKNLEYKILLCSINNNFITNKKWSEYIVNDNLLICVLPNGDGEKNPLRTVLQLMVLAGSIWIGYYYPEWAYLGVTFGVAGNMAINAILPLPKPPGQELFKKNSPSPAYSINGQRNTARLLQPIPEHFGKHIVFPDLATKAWTYFDDNEQYLCEIFCIGVGEYEIEKIQIGDTPISSFDLEYKIIKPYESVDLFYDLVVVSDEVSGQELLLDESLGPFTASKQGQNAEKLMIDIIFPYGLYRIGELDGNIYTNSVRFIVEARQIGSDIWHTLGNHELFASTIDPLRYTFTYDVAGRYEVKITKKWFSYTDTQMFWQGLKAVLPQVDNYGDVTLLAMKILATEVSSQSIDQINLIATRKLPVYDPSINPSWELRPTRSIAWAITYILQGCQFDLDGLIALDAIWNERKDYFDGRFDFQSTMWDALTSLARAGRAIPIDVYGKIFFVRPQQQEIYKAVFLPANIVKNSFRIEYIFPDKDAKDSVVIEYFNEENWQYDEVECLYDTSQNPEKIRFFGITNREQAWREGMYILACKKYQTQKIIFETELDGHIPQFGDLCAISHDLYSWASSGEIISFDQNIETNIETSEPLLWQDGEIHIIGFRSSVGNLIGPYICVKGLTERHLILTEPIDYTPQTIVGNRTSYVFGIKDGKFIKDCLVSAVIPRKQSVELHFINDSKLIYTADQGFAPPINSNFETDSGPVIENLTGNSNIVPNNSSFGKVYMNLSWSPNADQYKIQILDKNNNFLNEEIINTNSYQYVKTCYFIEGQRLVLNNFKIAAIKNDQMGIWAKYDF